MCGLVWLIDRAGRKRICGRRPGYFATRAIGENEEGDFQTDSLCFRPQRGSIEGAQLGDPGQRAVGLLQPSPVAG